MNSSLECSKYSDAY